MLVSGLRSSSGRLILLSAAVGSLIAVLAVPRIAVGNAPSFPDPEGVASEPTRLSEDVLLASGAYRGGTWSLTTYESSVGKCITLHLTGSIRANGESCGIDQRGDGFSFAQSTVAQLKSTWVYGTASRRITNVDVTLSNGVTKMIPVSAITASGTDYRYYVAIVPGEAIARSVSARANDGSTVARREISLSLG